MTAAGAIVVAWIGNGSVTDAALTAVCAHVEEVFAVPVRVVRPAERPTAAYDPARRQDSSTATLRWLVERGPPDAVKLLGVTDRDLYIPVLTYVFGEAQLGGRGAVVSTARLNSDRAGLSADETVVRDRLVKECVHELGHTFGLTHCRRRACVMSRSDTVVHVDEKAGTLCRDCATLLQQLRLEESP